MRFFILLTFLLSCFGSVPIFAMEKEFDDQPNYQLFKASSDLAEALTGKIDEEAYRNLKQKANQFKFQKKYEDEAHERQLMLSFYARQYEFNLEFDLLDLAEAFQNCEKYAEEAQVRDWILFYTEETTRPGSPYYNGTTNHPFDDSQNILTICSEDTKKSRSLIEAARAHSNSQNYLRAAELWDVCLSIEHEEHLKKKYDYKECLQKAAHAHHKLGNLERETNLRRLILHEKDANHLDFLNYAEAVLPCNNASKDEAIQLCLKITQSTDGAENLKSRAADLIKCYASEICHVPIEVLDSYSPKIYLCNIL